MTNPFSLPDQEIHFLYFSLDSISIGFEKLFLLLNQEEREKADRFYFQKDRERFILSKGILRKILGKYLHQDPEKISFSSNSFGKPELQIFSPHRENNSGKICFNISHSENVFLVAISRDLELGVDIEFIRPNRPIEKIIEKYFSPEEKKELLQKNEPERLKNFYQLWTCKEAFIKGIGEGMHFPLREVNFCLEKNRSSMKLQINESLKRFSGWSVELLDCPIKDAVSAFAVNSSLENLKVQDWINPSFW